MMMMVLCTAHFISVTQTKAGSLVSQYSNIRVSHHPELFDADPICVHFDYVHDNLNDDFLRPKWWDKVSKWLHVAADLWDFIGIKLWPESMYAGDGSEVNTDVPVDLSSEGISAMKDNGVFYFNGELIIEKNVLAAYNEAHQSIFIKAGKYKVNDDGHCTLTFTNISK